MMTDLAISNVGHNPDAGDQDVDPSAQDVQTNALVERAVTGFGVESPTQVLPP